MTADLLDLSATEAGALIAARKISSEELVQACLDRISAREDEVRAWQHLDPDYAIAEARRADTTEPLGPLHGVPFGVKDIIDTADQPTEYGSPIFAGHRPTADAACVAAMRKAGAVMMGKTVTTEFATFNPGKTRNPHNPAHTPGGSSSGSAAAVGDRMLPLAFGTQTAGSLIRPSAFCGVAAFKPTHGTVDLTGVLELVPRLDTLGYMGRSIDDLALFYGTVRGDDILSAVPDGIGRAPRIGICRTHHWSHAEPSSVEAVEAAAALCASLGAEVGECDLPPHFADLSQTHTTIICSGLARSLKDIYRNRSEALSERLRGMIEAGIETSAERHEEALCHADRCMMEFSAIAGKWDAILTPATPGEAPEGLAATGDPIFQVVWTLLQVPCVTFPWATGPNGLPVGIQLVARKGDDARLLSVAKWLQARKD